MSGLIVPYTEDNVASRFSELGIPLPTCPAWNKELENTLSDFFAGKLLKVVDMPDNKIHIIIV